MNEKKILGLVDRMIQNKIVLDGKIYYSANDVMAITDAMHERAMDNVEAIRKVLN